MLFGWLRNVFLQLVCMVDGLRGWLFGWFDLMWHFKFHFKVSLPLTTSIGIYLLLNLVFTPENLWTDSIPNYQHTIWINVQIRLRDLSLIEPKLPIPMGMPLEQSHSQPNGNVDNWQKPKSSSPKAWFPLRLLGLQVLQPALGHNRITTTALW